MQIRFPPSFLWGAALSSYQSEGGNFNSDWYLWEKAKALEPCGRAAGHYQLFRKDFKLARRLNLNSLRISLEWSRICPSSGEVSQEALNHYQDVIDALLTQGLRPLVTLHHFTNPIWFAQAGGWLHAKNIDFFLAYLKTVVEALKSKVDCWFILNEPLVYIFNGCLEGSWPPGKLSFRDTLKVFRNMVDAYLAGYQLIKEIYGARHVEVSLTKHMMVFSACPRARLALNALRGRLFNRPLCDYLAGRQALDFIALNYYRKEYSEFGGLFGRECLHRTHLERQNYLGWYVYPQGLYDTLLELRDFNLPIMIAENGTAERQDRFYQDYLLSHLRQVAWALAAGVDIKGYLWWSLIDNFEWDKGFGPRFGLARVDYRSLGRKLRPFAYAYGKICKENAIEI